MEEAAAFESSTIGKDRSSSSNPSGGSGSVLTDHDDGIADYTCDHDGVPSPAGFARTVAELPNSTPATTTSTSSSTPTKTGNSTRRSAKKRTISVPITEVEGIKGPVGDCTPPPDAWTWRKYGQKPIKGSPYPRGYYRCSSSKGCPARKQVERSRLDPSMLLVSYAFEHNHPLPVRRGHGHGHCLRSSTGQGGNSRRTAAAEEEKEEAPPAPSSSLVNTGVSSQEESTFTDLGDVSSFMPMGGDFCWFSGLVETPLPTTVSFMDEEYDAAMPLPVREVGEDDALFAGLGELPECSVVFRRPSIPSTHGGGQLDGYGAVV